MSLPEVRAKVKAGIWQAIAQSGVNMSSLSQTEIDRLVGAITEGVLKEMDDFLSQASGQPVSTAAPVTDDDDDVEKVLWEGRPYLSLSTHYTITNQRVRIKEGLLGKDIEDIELVRVRDIDYEQGLTERMFNIGDIIINSNDATRPKIVLNNVANPMEVHEILRRAVLKARKKFNVGYREEM
jgi:hypothetical protein